MNRGDSLAELPRMSSRQGAGLGLAQEGRVSEGGNSEASSHVDQLISAFEHISTQQPKTISPDAGDRRHAVQASTLKQLSEASPIKEKASLHRQLAALQEDLQAKQAQIVAQRKDVNYRQHLLQYAAGAARREVLELQAHRERASTALAAAQQQIMVLTCALTEARAMPNKSQMASTQEGQGESIMLLEGRVPKNAHVAHSEATSGELSLPGTPQRSAVSLQEAAAVTRSQAARQYVHGHTVSVSLLSDSEDEHRPDEAVSSPSVHVHLRVQQHEQPAAEQQLRGQLLEQQQLCEALQSRSALLEAEMGAKDAQRVALLAEVALLRSQAAKAEQRIGVLEGEVVALMAQAEQSSYEHELAQQELALLTNRISDSVGALPVAMEPVEEELAAAQQRLAESSVEVQRLTAVAAACREELEQVKLSQVEAGRQAENDRDAREALWQKLQEANQKLSDASRDALGREAELEQRLGMAEYGQQMVEVQSSQLHAELQQRSSLLQDIQVLAIAASAAATGSAAQAVAERDSVYVDFGSLAEDMLAVQGSLQAFSRTGGSSSELPAEAASSAAGRSGSPEHCSPRPRPCTAPATSKELSGSCCSSISFTKGIATWDMSTAEVSSKAPTTLHGALSARKWLDGQISPPRHPAPGRVHNPAAVTLPLLMPPPAAQEGRPTPRLASALPDSQRTSAENPLLLIETPVGGTERGPSWTMDLPRVAPDNIKRWATSCPTTPNTAFFRAAQPHTAPRAGLIQSAKAPAGRTLEDAEMRRNAKRQLFAQAADLAADLARLRKRIQDRLQQLPACSGTELSQLQGCSVANSGALSLSSYCSQGPGSVVAASPRSRPSCDVGSTVGMLHRAVSQSGHTPCGGLSSGEDAGQLSMPQTAALSKEASPDLASMPPRIQRIAQMALLSKAADVAPPAVEGSEVPHAGAAANEAGAPVHSEATAEAKAHDVAPAPPASAPTTATGSVEAHAPRKRKQKHLLRSLVALPILAVAFVAHPGIAGCCAAAAASLVGKSGQGSRPKAQARENTPTVQDNSRFRQGERRAKIHG